MANISTLDAILLGHVVAAGLTVGLVAYLLRNFREKLLGRVFAVLVGSFAIWIAGSAVRVFITDPGLYVAITVGKYVGVATAPVWFLLFALVYTGHEELVNRKVIGGLLVIPALTILVLATTFQHGLFYSAFHVVTVDGLRLLETDRGLWFWVFAAFGWGLLALGSAVILYGVYQRPSIYRAQSVVIVLGIAVPWATSLAYIFRDWPHSAVDPTPLGFAVSSGLFALGLFSTRLIDLAPVARSRVLDMIEDGVIVLDSDRRLVYANDAARPLLAGSTIVGAEAAAVLPSELVDASVADGSVVELSQDGEDRVFRVRTRSLPPEGEDTIGIVLTDLTEVRDLEHVRAEKRELTEWNERLEEFATAVSHDLRNPLTTAKGYLDLARAESEGQTAGYLDIAEAAYDRMERLIDGILTLARQGHTIEATDRVDLEDIAHDAWSAVDADDATLSISSDLEAIRADGEAMIQVFDNLFRNAVDHAGNGVRITIGCLEDGFFLEDDGPGIPKEEQARVFEGGYSSHAGRPGLGLKIVKMIVDAHGWEIHLSKGSAGGTRVEITGVGEVGTAPSGTQLGEEAIGTSS